MPIQLLMQKRIHVFAYWGLSLKYGLVPDTIPPAGAKIFKMREVYRLLKHLTLHVRVRKRLYIPTRPRGIFFTTFPLTIWNK